MFRSRISPCLSHGRRQRVFAIGFLWAASFLATGHLMAGDVSVHRRATADKRPPITKASLPDEVHLQLKDNRVAVVPVNALVEQVDSLALRALRESSRGKQVYTAGPVRGWNAKVFLDIKQLPVPKAGVKSRVVRAAVDAVTFEPIHPQVGHAMDLDADRCRVIDTELTGRDPQKTSVTVWVYPDSFGVLEQLQRSIRAQGFRVAVRPLPDHVPIGASPKGTRSIAR